MIHEVEFRTWLINEETYDPNDKSADTYIADIGRVKRRIGRGLNIDIDIDAEFEKDGLAWLIGRFEDTPENAAILRETTRFMRISEGTSSARSYKSSVNHYKVFRELRHPRQVG